MLDGLVTYINGHGGNYVSGHSVRVTDFLFYEFTEKMLAMDPDFAENYPSLMAVREHFEAVPPIKRYKGSGDFVPYLFPPGQTAVNTRL